MIKSKEGKVTFFAIEDVENHRPYEFIYIDAYGQIVFFKHDTSSFEGGREYTLYPNDEEFIADIESFFDKLLSKDIEMFKAMKKNLSEEWQGLAKKAQERAKAKYDF